MTKTMKDSGIIWIGKIPEDWQLRKLKAVITCKDRQRVPIDAGERKSGIYPYWGAGSITDYVDSYLFDEKLVLLGEDGAPFFDKKRNVAFLINEKVWVNNHIHVLKADKMVIPEYLVHYLNIVDFGSYINGSILNKLTQSNMNNINIAFPSEEEQWKIARFLDDKIGEIDAIISRTKESIEEYKKYKQAVITEVALGGINKKVTMKDSGIEWIGQIPEHWEIIPFKFVMNERNEKNIPVQTEERLALSIDKGITTYAEKTTNLDRFKDDVTQYKLAHEGDLVFNSMNMIVGAIGYSNYFGCVSPVYYTYYDNVEGHYTSKYYEYIFRSKTMRKVLFSLGKGIMAIDRGDDKINTCRLKVSRDDLRCLKVPVPTVKEQKEIVEYLDGKCKEIEELIAKKEAFVAEMEIYKKTVIYEYVTGKKEVL